MAGDNLGNKEGPAFLELTVWETVGGETPNDGDDEHEMVIQRRAGDLTEMTSLERAYGEALG
ncbi:unnamed protein product, partial [Rangifer tarandus platyrhynchus]